MDDDRLKVKVAGRVGPRIRSHSGGGMRFLDACMGRPVDTTPVWLMRQAGRYLPEYRAMRERADFLAMCRSADLATEVTLMPMRRYDLDAAIVFSDIMVPVMAMGVPVQFLPEPRITEPLRTREQVASLRPFDPLAATPFVMETIARLRALLPRDRALLGFAGAPFTVATYMVEGGGSRHLARVKAMMYREPALFDDLLARLADATASYLMAQIDAGADAVQVFDTWAGELTAEDFRRFALPAARSVVSSVRRPGVPVIYFLNGAGGVAEQLAEVGADVVSVDHRLSLVDAIRRIGPGIRIQGNLDPAVLLGPAEVVRAKATDVVQAGRAAAGHVFNLGHGVLPDTPPENVSVLVDAVHEAGRRG